MMEQLDLNGVPEAIQRHLLAISNNISFTDVDRKAGNGYVFFGQNKVIGAEVTVKYYYWGGEPHLHAEPAQLAQIKAANVLQIFDAGEIDGDYGYYLTPTCAHGDLDDFLELGTLGLRSAIEHACQVLIGLSHLHAAGFLHRDLKPANIYVNGGRQLVIGDFGSVKKLPEGHNTIPPSQHSLLYRPPESFAGAYGMTGDIYQCGIILFQLLGGKLPYEQSAYLNTRQKRTFESIESHPDQCIYVNDCIQRLICAGQIIKFATLPPWVPASMKRIIKKSLRINPNERYQSVTAFLTKLHEAMPALLDWQIVDGLTTLLGPKSYRIVKEDEAWGVEKKVKAGFRKDNSFAPSSMENLIHEIIAQAQAQA